jgi:uncharacterized protein (DUF2252 family)
MAMLQQRPEPERLPTAGERRAAGQAIRRRVPRSLHARWTTPPDRPDPVRVIIETGRNCISSLLPIRYERMRRTAFAYLRGTAAVMAADLATTPTSGLMVQACGDAHPANFGVYASPEGTPVFDVNDFDETLPAPFEWDLKRLAVGLAVDADGRGMPTKTCRNLARTAALAYRTQMKELMRLDPLATWHTRVDAAAAVETIDDADLRERELRLLLSAVEAERRHYPRLLERRHGQIRIRPRPPLIMPLTELTDDTHEVAARSAFGSYTATLPHFRRVLLDRFRLVDVAFKVVGVGSVGRFCAIGLYLSGDNDPLLLQMKEAYTSVLAPYAGPSVLSNAGERVVTGQRLMQATPDPLLGWTKDPGDDLHCYVRTLKDPKLARAGDLVADGAMPHHAALCGQVLARAHARSGDAAAIAGYMGSGSVFDAAIADFALDYAEQTRQDYRAFLAAIDDGLIEALGE